MEKFQPHIESNEQPNFQVIIWHLVMNSTQDYDKYFKIEKKDGVSTPEWVFPKLIQQNLSILSTSKIKKISWIISHLWNLIMSMTDIIVKEEEHQWRSLTNIGTWLSPNEVNLQTYNQVWSSIWSIHCLTQLLAWAYEKNGDEGIQSFMSNWLPSNNYSDFDTQEWIYDLLAWFAETLKSQPWLNHVKAIMQAGRWSLSYIFDPTKFVKYRQWGTKIDDLAIDELKKIIISRPKSETDQDLKELQQQTQATINEMGVEGAKKVDEIKKTPTKNIKRETSYIQPWKSSSKYDIDTQKKQNDEWSMNDPNAWVNDDR